MADYRDDVRPKVVFRRAIRTNQPNRLDGGANPNHIALAETVTRINGQPF